MPTYEELKRAPHEAVKKLLAVCFLPTYEELKPAQLDEWVRWAKGFLPTYEELKQRVLNWATEAEEEVFCLPMRN